jgi:hypothetical protein
MKSTPPATWRTNVSDRSAVNCGVAPGDQHIDQPYVYVGPPDGRPAGDDFRNAEFGAARTIGDIASPDDALAFFRPGRSLLGGPTPKS